ncbi:hypothetical protein [Variovorax guangxiensis]|uniref:Uncharacterized protein n=1 Tax=Variovorax guangxiensis TaxID=1775474 RepID=A0A502DKB5_9BURK|nr:hypothetical protein [Variovorax guangxiensis]TPG20740.1 hypothetical protein EAH83_18500 [Variovorax ginsengisoli]TPG25673.1 hypothetical protein EAH82_14635 [Variovorax guangxiensis]
MYPSPFAPREVWAALPLAKIEPPKGALRSKAEALAAARVTNESMRDRALAERLCVVDPPWQPALAPSLPPGCVLAYTDEALMHPPTEPAPTVRFGSLHNADSLLAVRHFAKSCIHAGPYAPVAFTLQRGRRVPTEVGRKLLGVMPGLHYWTEVFDSRLELHSDRYVDLALGRYFKMKVWQEFKLGRVCWASDGSVHESTAKLLNSYVEDLHQRGDRLQTGAKLGARGSVFSGRVAKVRDHLAKTLKAHADLAIKRFDLVDGRIDLTEGASWPELQKAVREFVRQVMKTYGKAVVCEYGKIDALEIVKPAMHVLLAFAGPNATELRAIDRALEALWVELTKGYGMLLNCSAVAELSYRGTDLQNQRRGTPLEQIERAAWYLAGTDELYEVRHGAPRLGLGGLKLL